MFHKVTKITIILQCHRGEGSMYICRCPQISESLVSAAAAVANDIVRSRYNEAAGTRGLLSSSRMIP